MAAQTRVAACSAPVKFWPVTDCMRSEAFVGNDSSHA